MGFIAQIGTGGMIFIAILIVLFNVFLIYSRSKRIRQAMKAAKDERIALEKAQADSAKDSEQEQEQEQKPEQEREPKQVRDQEQEKSLK